MMLPGESFVLKSTYLFIFSTAKELGIDDCFMKLENRSDELRPKSELRLSKHYSLTQSKPIATLSSNI